MNNVNYDIADKIIQAGELTKVNPPKEAALNVTMVENLKMKENVMNQTPAAEPAPAETPVAEQPVQEAPAPEAAPAFDVPVNQTPEQPAFDVPAEPAPAETPVAEQPVQEAPAEAPAFDVPVNQTPEQPVEPAPVEAPTVETPVPEATPAEPAPAEAPAVEQPATDLNTVETVATPEMTMDSTNVADIQPIEEQTPVDLMQQQSQISEATVAPAPEAPAEQAPVINQVAGSPMEMPAPTDITERIEKLKTDFASSIDLLSNAFNESIRAMESKLEEAERKYKDEEARRKMAEDRVEELTQKEVHADNIINEVKNMRDEMAAQAPVAEQPAEPAPVAEPTAETPVVEAPSFEAPVEAPTAETPANDAVEEFISGDNAPTEAPGARVLTTAAGAASSEPNEPSPLDAFSPMETGDFGAVADINPPEESPIDNMGTKTV